MIPVSEPCLNRMEIDNVKKALFNNQISSQGEFIKKFEEDFAAYCGMSYGATCSNGTTALHLALLAIGIKEGDEVILPSFTMMATAAAVSYCGAKPVFVDTNPDTWNLEISQLQTRLSDKTKAVIIVHTYGNVCDMDPIKDFCKKNGLVLVVDAAQAHGARYKDSRREALGDVACFSFYANKIITTGEGGMVVTDNKEIIDKVNYYKNHCFKIPRFVHDHLGYNYRLTNVQAAIGCGQLEKINDIINKRKFIASVYRYYLKEIKGIIEPPVGNDLTENVYWMFGIILDESLRIDKDELMDYLYRCGIETRSFFCPMHKQPVYDTGEVLPVSERFYERGLYLPTYHKLTSNDIKDVCRTIKRFIRSKQ